MSHTQGKWLASKSKHGVDAGHHVIAVLDPDAGDRSILIHSDGEGGDPHADAERIVACVEATAGISTETLKKSGLTTCRSGQELILANKLADAMSALRMAVDTLANVVGDINPERGYADELEADVEGALGACRSAIAKCEGSK